VSLFERMKKFFRKRKIKMNQRLINSGEKVRRKGSIKPPPMRKCTKMGH
jgi:hypothetical protein